MQTLDKVIPICCFIKITLSLQVHYIATQLNQRFFFIGHTEVNNQMAMYRKESSLCHAYGLETYSPSLIVQITDFLEFLHEYCKENLKLAQNFNP